MAITCLVTFFLRALAHDEDLFSAWSQRPTEIGEKFGLTPEQIQILDGGTPAAIQTLLDAEVCGGDLDGEGAGGLVDTNII